MESTAERVFDLDAALQARDKAIAWIERNPKNVEFRHRGFDAVVTVALRETHLMCDDIWKELGNEAPSASDNRAMGSVLLEAARAGIITSAGARNLHKSIATATNEPYGVPMW